MLSIMRRQARSWMIKVILFAIVVVFIFWGVGGFETPQDNHVAVVNGEPISFAAYRQSYDRLREQYRRMYGAALDEQMIRNLRLNEEALNQLIDRVLLMQEAGRLNIRITDSVLDNAILEIPSFQTNGGFDEERAGFVLAQHRMTVADFRNILREDLMLEKLRELIVDGVTVSEAEAREWYDWYHAEVNLNYIYFESERYQDIEPTEDQISRFFQENEERYRTPPQVKVNYLRLDPEMFMDRISISDERAVQYYMDHPEEFSIEKTVEARHILFRVDEDADEETVAEQLRKATDVYQKAIGGEPFDELAKQYSEGPTRDQGGYLGAFTRDRMVAPFADKAFSMQAGEISEPVRTRFGWHIIKVEQVNEAVHYTLEESVDGIRENMLLEESRRLALKKAEEIYDTTFDGDELSMAARAHQLAVHTTNFISSRELAIEGVDNPTPFIEAAFALSPMSIGEPIELAGSYYVLQVVDRIEPAVPALEAVVDRVRADLIARLRDEQARADAEQTIAALQQGQSIAEAATAFGLQPMETGFFKRTLSIPQIGHEPEIIEAAFMLQPDQPAAEVAFPGPEGWYVITLNERRQPDDEGFAAEKDYIFTDLGEQKKQIAFDQWIADLKSRSQIRIERQLIQ